MHNRYRDFPFAFLELCLWGYYDLKAFLRKGVVLMVKFRKKKCSCFIKTLGFSTSLLRPVEDSSDVKTRTALLISESGYST